MATEIPSSCLPDKHLTKSHLQELFNDFNASIATSRPAASIFSALVNSVRLAYTTPLLDAREELMNQSKDYTRQLSELKQERDSLVRVGYTPRFEGVSPLSEGVEGGAVVMRGEATPSPDPRQIEWPGKIFMLHIFSSPFHHRRDWASWSDTFEDETSEVWSPRMDLKVFKFQEPGLVRVKVMWKRSPYRNMAIRDTTTGIDSWWKDHLEFWAFGSPRPGTQMIWSGYKDGPERGIFVRGEQMEGMEDWERKCEFWVPL